jgi:hypothetical protein
MQDWIREKSEVECKPCLLGPLASWYRDELTERGLPEKAAELEQVAESTDMDDENAVLTFCQKLDNIKEAVEAPLRERLKEFDCATQNFSSNDLAAADQQQQT